MKQIRGILFKDGEIRPFYVANNLSGFKRILEVDLIDIIEVSIEGEYYDMVVDDEALLKEDPKPSVINRSGQIICCGPVFICRSDRWGNEVSLRPNDLLRIPYYEGMIVVD